MIYVTYINSPVGMVQIRASEKGITHVTFIDESGVDESDVDKLSDTFETNATIKKCAQQLKEYFYGQRKSFDLPLDWEGTVFQQSIWQSLLDVPFGAVASYSDIATAVNNPKAVRAVGAANGKNPIAIIVPCHRIIGSNGTLTGYAGGMDRKAWLLSHEGAEFKVSPREHPVKQQEMLLVDSLMTYPK
ncbi:MAG: methylated-DNA--[protein]-cysteine S-methyltransferase [Cellvibrionaceae bacterium]